MNKSMHIEKNKIKVLIVKNIFITIVLGILAAFLANTLLRMSLFDWNWLQYIESLENQAKRVILLELGILFLIYIWLASILRSKWGAISLYAVFTISISVANHQKLLMRGEPIYPSDFDMIKVLPELMGMIDFKIALLALTFTLVMIILTVWLTRKERLIRKIHVDRKYSFMSIIFFIIISFSIALFYNFNEPENIVRASFDPYSKWITWSQRSNYRENGFVSGFLFNLPGQSINKPNIYSKDSVGKIIDEYMQKAEERNESLDDGQKINPNVLFIMNESFSDPENLEGIELSDTPIPYYKKLSEHYMSGNILVSGYGGGTANTEFEAWTGISLEPLAANITTPYIQMDILMDQIPSLVSYFNKRSYRTAAIHPYNTTMYKRPSVYSSFGFDDFIHEETLQNIKYHENNGRISDLSSYQEVLYQMKKTEKKDFIHLVTMHGHSPYENNYENLNFKIEEVQENHEILEQYYQGLYYSDLDLKYLIEEINRLDEDTLIVFWGDHLPGIYKSDVFTENNIDKYETPVLFYTNFESNVSIEEIEIISPIYFMNYVTDILKEPISGYTAFMKEMEEHIPAFKRGMYIEDSSALVVTDRNELTKESQKMLEQYDMILYDLLEGNQLTVERGFFEAVQ